MITLISWIYYSTYLILNCNNDLVSLIFASIPPSNGVFKTWRFGLLLVLRIGYLGVISDLNFQTFSVRSQIVCTQRKRSNYKNIFLSMFVKYTNIRWRLHDLQTSSLESGILEKEYFYVTTYNKYSNYMWVTFVAHIPWMVHYWWWFSQNVPWRVIW